MDPITLLLDALAIGVKLSATQAVQDAYNHLKSLIQEKFAARPEAKATLAKYEQKPAIWKEPLKEELLEVAADQDIRLLQVAGKLIEQARSLEANDLSQTASGHHPVQVSNQSNGDRIGGHKAGKDVVGGHKAGRDINQNRRFSLPMSWLALSLGGITIATGTYLIPSVLSSTKETVPPYSHDIKTPTASTEINPSANEPLVAEQQPEEQPDKESEAREKAEAERQAREKAEAERKAKERQARERAEAERQAKEQAEAERLAREQAEAERKAREQAEAERQAKEQAEAERLAREQAEAERLAQERAEHERLRNLANRPKPQPEMTQAEYDAIQMGMTYEQVVEIVQSFGRSDSVNGPFASYVWDDGGPFGVRLVFNDNRLTMKNSYGFGK